MRIDYSLWSVEVKLELGHRGVLREKKTVEGFTHDWTVFVRGEENNPIHSFVEKVVFHLHESFPKPKRVFKEPPYSVSESGYAGFIMPIDVYFRTKEEPKKVTFNYDLFLRLQGPPVSNLRIEKLTFQNPSPDFRKKLIEAGGLAGALTGAAGGSASLSTQACIPPQHADDHQSSNHPRPSVAEKKPRPHVPSKDLPSKPLPPPPAPKPSQPFTDIFGAPIRTKSSPDSTSVISVKPKDSGHSSQAKSKVTPSSLSTGKDIKQTKEKESHKSKDSHHSSKESHHPVKETHSSKDTHQSKDPPVIKKSPQPKDSTVPPPIKDSHSSKESHHSSKEKHSSKEHHSKEKHKSKESHHSSKEKPPKDPRPPELKESKPHKPIKPEKESSKPSVTKRPAPTDFHSSHGNVEKKKKSSPVSSESSDKSSSHSKHKIKESKNKSEKHKNKLHSHSVKKEEEKPKHKSSPAPQPKTPPEPKEPLKPKPNSPFKAPSPAVVVKPPSPPPKPPSPPPIIKPLSPVIKPPSPESSSMDSDSDESHKSYYNKAQYSSPASSISESSLHGSNPISGLMSDHSIISPLSDEDSDSSPSVPNRKLSSDYDLDGSPVYKPLESKPMPKLKKKHHSHHKLPYKSKSSDSYHQGNGSISNDISMHHSPNIECQKNCVNNTAYREELLELQRIIMTSEDRKLLQYIVDLIEETGKYEVTNTTFDFDLCSLDPAIIHKIKLYLQNCDKYV